MRTLMIVMFRLTLSAFAPLANSQAPALHPVSAAEPSPKLVVPMETLEVTPQAEDLPPPARDRWQRFEEMLNAGRSSRFRKWHSATNDGVRSYCYESLGVTSCVSRGGLSLAGKGLTW
jgi:hypothetical protein